MAVTLRSLGLAARSHTGRLPSRPFLHAARPRHSPSCLSHRTFTTSTALLVESPSEPGPADSAEPPEPVPTPLTDSLVSTLSPEARVTFDAFTPAEKSSIETELLSHHSSSSAKASINTAVTDAIRTLDIQLPPATEPRPERFVQGFLSMGEDDEEEIGPDDEFQNDDITSLAHGELDQHREIRHYFRIAAWEMPLLAEHAQTFRPPTQSQILRFRTTTYLGETHPAAAKIVVEFSPTDLSTLTPPQRAKLIKLAGPRYNPSTDLVKMSCEQFPADPARNKRHLHDLVARLVAEARDDEGDTFEDVPFDFRHHVERRRFRFPREWRMTEERRGELEERRERERVEERERDESGVLLDGVREVERAYVVLEDRRFGGTGGVSALGAGGQGDKGKAKGKTKLRR